VTGTFGSINRVFASHRDARGGHSERSGESAVQSQRARPCLYWYWHLR